MEIEFEMYFEIFFMFIICGLEVGSKKCYVGVICKGDEVKFVFKGFESVCLDWILLVKMF